MVKKRKASWLIEQDFDGNRTGAFGEEYVTDFGDEGCA
jgi:hypothetical protein